MGNSFAEKRETSRYRLLPSGKYEVDIDLGSGEWYHGLIKDIGLGGIGITLISDSLLPDLYGITVHIHICKNKPESREELAQIDCIVRWVLVDTVHSSVSMGLHYTAPDNRTIRVLEEIIKEAS